MKRNLFLSLTMTVVVVLSGSQEPTQRHDPRVTFDGGTQRERDRMYLAIQRFEEVGLDLPQLHILFRKQVGECYGFHGYFSPSQGPWQITICSHIDSIYEHELAHAWELANLTDEQRRWFVAHRDLPAWSDTDIAWNGRGVEEVANTIQHGLASLPLSPALGEKTISRLRDFELLTGRVAPRLIEWMALHEASCRERPTPLSSEVPDSTGRVCRTSLGLISRDPGHMR